MLEQTIFTKESVPCELLHKDENRERGEGSAVDSVTVHSGDSV